MDICIMCSQIAESGFQDTEFVSIKQMVLLLFYCRAYAGGCLWPTEECDLKTKMWTFS